ncbi:hypothetical protein E3O45_01790 [Cryobacterium sp. TMS1-20-1]|uniref:hypothetical protein n=1 Tax=unclassified Cryobacterium TaxID=2649013 RepID=UPI001069563F|nr:MULTISPECIES: hypothetical protein [unclassified Cryobacterium]TFC80777.1 hypothetical protein E3O45_01790 [Cryobacterium sp. TMS1-20-1]TFD51294.1 hypothetical protein E3T46_08560 [Cryobacterium sp. Hh11]
MTEHKPVQLLDGSSVVLAIVRPSGACDTQEFLRSLNFRFLARYQRYLEYLRDGVLIKSPENFRRLSLPGSAAVVFEIKVDKYRLYIVRFRSAWYATHGRVKPKDNQVNQEIKKALEIFWEGIGDVS